MAKVVSCLILYSSAEAIHYNSMLSSGWPDCLLSLRQLPLLRHRLRLVTHATVIDLPQVSHPKVIALYQHLAGTGIY